MRGTDVLQEALFTTVHLEIFVLADHPLRPLRQLFNEALGKLNGLFESIYADGGRDSIAPEKLLRAQLLQVLYSIRSERQLVEQLHYNLLFRWFVGLAIDDVVWNHSTFSKNRDRLLEHEVIPELFAEVVKLAGKHDLLSTEHFSVDGTLIQAWASQKSFVRKDGSDAPPPGGGRNAERDFRGQARSNDTHESTTDPDCRALNITPHVACNDQRPGGSQLDARTTRHVGYEVSQRIRKRVEEPFGWGKLIGLIRQVKVRGLEKVNDIYLLTCMGWNLVRMRNLLAACT